MSTLKIYTIMDKITEGIKKELILEKNDKSALRTFRRYQTAMIEKNRFYRKEEEELICIGYIDETSGMILGAGEKFYYRVESIESVKYRDYDEENEKNIEVKSKEEAKEVEKRVRAGEWRD